MDSLLKQLKDALGKDAKGEELKSITDELYKEFAVTEISFSKYPNIHCGPKKVVDKTNVTHSRK